MIIECTKQEASWIVYALHQLAINNIEKSQPEHICDPERNHLIDGATDFENLSDRISMELYGYNPNNR